MAAVFASVVFQKLESFHAGCCAPLMVSEEFDHRHTHICHCREVMFTFCTLYVPIAKLFSSTPFTTPMALMYVENSFKKRKYVGDLHILTWIYILSA
jgi:hypothetical protein